MPLFILKKAFIVKILSVLTVKKNARIYKEFNKKNEIKVNKAVSLIFERRRFKMHNGYNLYFPENNSCVVSAKPKSIAHCNIYGFLFWFL